MTCEYIIAIGVNQSLTYLGFVRAAGQGAVESAWSEEEVHVPILECRLSFVDKLTSTIRAHVNLENL